MAVTVQCFRRDGVIICVKVGYIAADIPTEWHVRKAELVGTSLKGLGGTEDSTYYDIALDGRDRLHIMKDFRGGDFRPFFFEEYPI